MSSTERILNALPPSFRPDPRPRPWLLPRVVDAFGRWLLEVENLLVAVMRAHWVDFADQGAREIRDLARLAALFALAPRADEDVETFRVHLERYVRTFLEGSATVRGVLRLAASTLALSIEDELDPTPGAPPFVVEIIRPDDDVALKLFGFGKAEVHGVPPGPARLVGGRDLSAGVDLSAARILQLAVDRDNIATVDVAGADPRTTTLWEIARHVNAALGIPAAAHDGRALVLTSGLTGSDGEVELGSPAADAADAILGVAPRHYPGIGARAAEVLGTVDLSPAGGVAFMDLRDARYLRVAVDGGLPVEVDCAGADPEATTLDEVRDRINAAVGSPVASHDGHTLALRSPTQGAGSQLELPAAPAEDARDRLLGPVARRTQRGLNASPGRLLGRADLSEGIELPARATLRLRIDGGEAFDVALTGEEPAACALADIVARMNAVFGAPVASHDGRRLTVTSGATGAGSRIDVLVPAAPAVDATRAVLGVVPRRYEGTLPDRARLDGLVTLDESLDLRLQRRLWLSIDGGPLLDIDCAAPDAAHTPAQHVVDAINHASGTTVAFREGGRLVLQSPTVGGHSALVLRAPQGSRRRYFYTRGRVREDAATTLFGFAGGRAEGRLPEPARLVGQVDLGRGVDLRVAHTLRILVDDRDPREIRVADPQRPLVTLLPHVVDVINGALEAQIASARDGRLVLISVAEGPEGRIAIGTSTASDAGSLLFGASPGTTARGTEAERVTFVGMADVSRGLDVRTTHRLRVGIDERPVTEIDLQSVLTPGAVPVLAPAQIVAVVNRQLNGDYASHDGRRITLTSRRTGSASSIRIELAADHDATRQVFGLDVPRSYVGRGSARARLIGRVDLSAGIDLSTRGHLTLEIDGRRVEDIDCAGANPARTELSEIIAAINKAARGDVAGAFEGGRLVVSSRITGSASAVVLGESTAADAGRALLGDAPRVATGAPGQPAVLIGRVALNRPVDLSRRSVIRLTVDGGESREIDCAGERPARTFPAEVIDLINAAIPGLASMDSERHLNLVARQRIEIVPLRSFTLFEFPPVQTRGPDQGVSHGVRWSVHNDGVGASRSEWVLTSLHGVDRPRLTNLDTGEWVQVEAVLPPNFTLHVRVTEDDRFEAWMEAPGRGRRDLAAVVAHPGVGALTLAPGESHWQYTDCLGDRFDSAHFAGRPRGGVVQPLLVPPARFAGGLTCHAPAAFNQSRFYDPQRPETENTFGSRTAPAASAATSAFVYQEYQAGRFELELPSDLPPQFGGRFNGARFTHREGTGGPQAVVYTGAIFDLPEDPRALDEMVKSRPTMVTVGVALEPDEGVPIYDAPFREEKPLAGGTVASAARAYLRQPGVPGVTEVRARAAGTWGNLVVVAVPESATPGAFDVAFRYTGRDVFENARPKVAAQLAFARAAGVLAEVTRR